MNKWKLTKGIFGPLWPYIEDDSVTDIDWDGDSLWIEYANGAKQSVRAEGIDDKFVANFTQFVANHVARPFNQVENTLSAETDTLRITVAHESLVTSGRCFSIRKSMPKLRFSATSAIRDGYCPAELMNFLVNCVELKSNFAFCGEPGHGKTECAKFFSTFIEAADKVITVEDTLEWHYKYINRGKRADEIKVNSNDDYVKAIKLALRLNPTWLMLSEARSTEVRYLIEGWTTGVCGMTTLHTNDVRNIPDRVVNMMGQGIEPSRMINNVYTHLDIGLLLEKRTDRAGNVKRQITQAAVFERNDGRNLCTMLMENAVFEPSRIPEALLWKMKKAGMDDPCESRLLKERLEQEADGILYGMEVKREWEDTPERGMAVAEDIEELW